MSAGYTDFPAPKPAPEPAPGFSTTDLTDETDFFLING
jgi:hypothetical protein